MKSNIIATSFVSVILVAVLLVASVWQIKIAVAQVEATSSSPVTDASSSTATAPVDAASSTTATEAAGPVVTGKGPQLVHINGTKYTDYFTDGMTITSFPGDPKIDGNLDKPDAPIPMHEGLTWVHTTGSDLYDTPSGDLEIGDYVEQSTGSYIGHLPASTYTDATSSVALPARFVFVATEEEVKSAISAAIATEATSIPPAAPSSSSDILSPSDVTSSPATSSSAAAATTSATTQPSDDSPAPATATDTATTTTP